MSASRAVLLLAGAGLAAAWLAAASDRQRVNHAAGLEHRDADARAEHLGAEIQSQATRLRARLAAAPQPAPSGRNPFVFEAPGRGRRAEPVRGARVDPSLQAALSATAPDPPPISLSGIAEEEENPSLPARRIAILSGY
jgi:hypothetical protein